MINRFKWSNQCAAVNKFIPSKSMWTNVSLSPFAHSHLQRVSSNLSRIVQQTLVQHTLRIHIHIHTCTQRNTMEIRKQESGNWPFCSALYVLLHLSLCVFVCARYGERTRAWKKEGKTATNNERKQENNKNGCQMPQWKE